MIFEYLAYNNIPMYLLTFGLIGIVIFFMLMNEYKNATNTKFFKRLKICLVISIIWFLCGIFLPSEHYYEKQKSRFEMYQILADNLDSLVDSKINSLKMDIDDIKINLDNLYDKLEK